MNNKAYYGEYGGQYVAESLMNTLKELEKAYREALADPSFIEEYQYYLKLHVEYFQKFYEFYPKKINAFSIFSYL